MIGSFWAYTFNLKLIPKNIKMKGELNDPKKKKNCAEMSWVTYNLFFTSKKTV